MKAGYGFENAEHAGELTTMQRAFLYRADVERRRQFLEAIAQIFSD